MKAKESKIAFFYFLLFFGIGTFQWVIGKKMKKIWFPSQVVRKTSQALFSFLLTAGALPDAGSIRRLGKRTESFWFWQEIVDSAPRGCRSWRAVLARLVSAGRP
jgi:hypothetical protein